MNNYESDYEYEPHEYRKLVTIAWVSASGVSDTSCPLVRGSTNPTLQPSPKSLCIQLHPTPKCLLWALWYDSNYTWRRNPGSGSLCISRCQEWIGEIALNDTPNGQPQNGRKGPSSQSKELSIYVWQRKIEYITLCSVTLVNSSFMLCRSKSKTWKTHLLQLRAQLARSIRSDDASKLPVAPIQAGEKLRGQGNK